MATERRMNFYESFYGLTSLLPERERQKVNTALLDYFFEGKEPEGLSDQGSKVFEGCRGRINASVRGRENIEKRYSGGSTLPTKKPSTYHSKPPSTYGSKSDSTLPTKKPSTYGTDRERDRDIDRDIENNGAKRRKFSPPSIEEISEYLTSAELDSVDPGRFYDYYEQQGWKLSNGNQMKDWKAAARNWQRRSKPKEVKSERGAFEEYLS